MKVGLIGLPQSGKTTIFNALTRQNVAVEGYAREKLESHLGVVKVPDPRLDHLAQAYQPKKLTHAEMVFTDIGCIKRDDGHSEFDMSALRGLDVLAVVIRAFDSDTVLHPLGDVDPQNDVVYLQSEFILEDLSLVEKRLERIEKELKKNKKDNQLEFEYLQKFKEHLEEEKPLRTFTMDSEGEKIFRGFQFLTLKPVLYIFNTGESDSSTASLAGAQDLLAEKGDMSITLCGNLEMEVSQLDEQDRLAFLAELGIAEPALNLFIRTAFSLLSMIVFFTVGKDEVRAWEIQAGITAKEAAGRIHSDISRGFIRAEVLSYDAFVSCNDSYTVARSKGLVRLEGKEYKVADGDMIEYRFNV